MNWFEKFLYYLQQLQMETPVQPVAPQPVGAFNPQDVMIQTTSSSGGNNGNKLIVPVIIGIVVVAVVLLLLLLLPKNPESIIKNYGEGIIDKDPKVLLKDFHPNVIKYIEDELKDLKKDIDEDDLGDLKDINTAEDLADYMFEAFDKADVKFKSYEIIDKTDEFKPTEKVKLNDDEFDGEDILDELMKEIEKTLYQ